MFFKKLLFLSRPTESPKCTDVECSKEGQESKEPRNSYFDAIVSNFRSTVGTGILAMPIAFSQAGYLGAIIGIIFITIITNYSALILVGCQRELLKRNKDMIPTYQGTVQAAFDGGPKSIRMFGPFFVTFTNVFILIGQIGGVCVDIVFISSNVKAAMHSYWDMDLLYFELLVAIPVLALSLIPNMKKMSILCILGNITLLISIGVVLYYVFNDPISFEDRHAFGEFNELPKYLGTVFYSCVTIAFVLPMENEMERPGMLEGPLGVLSVTAYSCAVLYGFFGLMGYLKYGDNAASIITLNLPSSDWLGAAVQILLSLSAFTSLGIALYIGVTVIWIDYLDKHVTKYRTLANYILRIGFVILTLIISIMVPDLQVLLAFLGIIMQCTLCTTMPCIINILTHYQQPSSWAYFRKFWLDVVTFLFTIFVLFCSFASEFIDGS